MPASNLRVARLDCLPDSFVFGKALGGFFPVQHAKFRVCFAFCTARRGWNVFSEAKPIYRRVSFSFLVFFWAEMPENRFANSQGDTVKIMSICPNCFGNRVRQKMGSSLIKEGGMLKIADDFGEVVECPDCNHIGVDSFAGNDTLIAMLKVRKGWKETVLPLVETPAVRQVAMPLLTDANTEILTVQVPKLE